MSDVYIQLVNPEVMVKIVQTIVNDVKYHSAYRKGYRIYRIMLSHHGELGLEGQRPSWNWNNPPLGEGVIGVIRRRPAKGDFTVRGEALAGMIDEILDIFATLGQRATYIQK